MAILAIAVLLQVHIGGSYLFAQTSRATQTSQVPQTSQAELITRQETLRGSITPEREWWDVLHYNLQLEFFPETKRIKGSNTITFKTVKPGIKMQIDLQPPLEITKITHRTEIAQSSNITQGAKATDGDRKSSSNQNSQLKFEREGNVYWVMFEKEIPKGVEDKIEIFYEGVPVVSKNPPWVGGISWEETTRGRDDLGDPLIVIVCEGIGASIWWPNRDSLVENTTSTGRA